MEVTLCPKATLRSIQNAGWIIPAELNTVIENHIIGDELLTLANLAETDGNLELAHSIACVAHAVRMFLEAEDWTQPYRPFWAGEGMRGSEVRDFNDEHLQIFKYVLPTTINPVIVSRLSDVLWLKTKEIDYAKKAIDNFIQTLEMTMDKDKTDITKHQNEVVRAIQLWGLTGADEQIRQKIANTVLRGLFLEDAEPDNYLRLLTMRTASESAILGEPGKWSTKCMSLADESLQKKNFRKARDYMECSMNFARQIKDDQNWKVILAKQTDLYAAEAEHASVTGAQATMQQHFYFAAIEANQTARTKIGGRKEIIDSLQKKLNEIQPDVLNSMAFIPFDLNLADQGKVLRAELEKRNTPKGLVLLASLTAPGSKQKYLSDAEKMMKESIVRHLFATVGYDGRGKVVHREPGVSLDDEKSKAAAVVREAHTHWKLAVLESGSLIERARIDLLHRFEPADHLFDEFIVCNPFVPKERFNYFRKGLLAGFQGDWLTSMHILVPQIENSIRHFMETIGILVTMVDADLIQSERDLNKILYMNEVSTAFNDDQLFQLRAIFTEKTGYNYRNLLAHGLLSESYFSGGHSYIAAFIWAHVIYLCVESRERFFAQLTKGQQDV